jgi:hypothetical protein
MNGIPLRNCHAAMPVSARDAPPLDSARALWLGRGERMPLPPPRPIDPRVVLPRVVRRTLAFLYTNAGYGDFVINTVRSIRRARCAWEPVIFCLDEASARQLEAHGLTCVAYPSDVSERVETWGTGSFKRIMVVKLDILRSLIASLREAAAPVDHLLYLDSDIVVLKDPLDYLVAEMARPGAPDTLFQCGERTSSCTDPRACKNRCAGFIFTRVTPAALDLFGYDDADPRGPRFDGDDQVWLNAKLRRVCPGYPQRTLPVALFPNGSQRHRDLRDKFVLHYNYLLSHEKRPAMEAAGHWYEAPPPRAPGRR